MIIQRPEAGNVIDELIENPRRLGIANACLGIAAAFVYWVRPGTFAPHLVKYIWFRGPSLIYLTVLAWMPYVIAFFVSKVTLEDRNPKAVVAYIIAASVITIGASGLVLNLFGMHATISPILIAAGVTISLLAAVGLCAIVWHSDTSIDDSSGV